MVIMMMKRSELENEMKKTALKISANSIIAALSIDTITNHSPRSIYDCEENYELSDYYNYMHRLHISNRFNLANSLEFASLDFPDDNTDDKTLLLSALVTIDQKQAVIELFKKFGQLFVDYDLTSNWQMRIIENNFDGYFLVNAFLTNNDNPQCLLLGYDIYHYINQNKDVVPPNSDLLQVRFSWHTDKPSKYYRKYLVAIDDDFDWDTQLAKIDQKFAKMYQDLTNNDLKHYGYNMSFYPNSIISLDLIWFINYSKFSQKNDSFAEHAMSVHRIESEIKNQPDSSISKIMKKLASNLQ